MKLLILLKNIDGGTGTYLEAFMGLKKEFKPHELDIRVLIIDKPKFRNTKSKSYIFFNSIKENQNIYKLTLDNLNSLIGEFKWFKKNLLEFKPDIVVASNFHSIFTSELSKFFSLQKYKTVSIIQNNLMRVFVYKLTKNFRWLGIILFRYFLTRSDKVITVSEYLSNDIQKYFNLKILPLTIQGALPNVHQRKIKNSDKFNKKIIVSVSRLDNQKDHETLLSAFQIINNKVPNSRLWIVGDGPNKNGLVKMSSELNLTDKVKFFNWKQNPLKILNKSSVFVLSSKWEGFPLSILEAMFCGLPIIASNCKYGPFEIIQSNKYGLLVPVSDANSLANATIKLLTNHREYNHFSKMSRLRLLNYPQEKMLTKYKNIIKELLQN